MLDLFAAIQSADPPSLVLWGLFVFAAGMYPIGFMLGASCSPCCGTPCSACETGSLPPTLTVTLDNLPEQTPGPDLISLSFSSCFGGGASGRVTAPGGDPDTDKGPISAVSLTNAGGGYAKLGRVAPTISVSGGSGTGATFTPTITSSNDACGVPSWTIASVAVKGGTGYVDGESLTVTIAEGDTEATAASVIVDTTRTQPTLTASASPGSGAVLSVTLSENYGSPTTWGVASVSVTNGGTGYTDGDSLTFAGGSATKVNEEASAYIYTGRSIPTLSASASIPGSGAVLTPTLTEYTDWNGRSYWSVTAFTITDGGAGYSVNDQIGISVDDGTADQWNPFSGYVSEVDEDGAITAITIDSGGAYWKDTGVIQSVEVWYGGSYHDDDGVPTGVTVPNGGQYYREDASETPYVATVTISISQAAPSDGTGAEITAAVDDDTSSATFGQVTGLTIEDGGDSYLAWQWRNTKCCGDYYNGMTVVLKRNNPGKLAASPPNPCVYSHRFCGVGNINTNPGSLGVVYYGPNTPPEIVLASEDRGDRSGATSSDTTASRICRTVFTTSQVVQDCDTWLDQYGEPLEFTSTSGATATLVVGGDYDDEFRDGGGLSCNICCKGAEPVTQEIEATITDPRENKTVDLSGTYVLKLFPRPPLGLRWVLTSGGINRICPDPNNPGECVAVEIQLEPCSSQSESSFSEDAYGCDFCHQKCRAFVAVGLGWSGVGYYFYYTSTEGADMCAMCQDTPICSIADMNWTATSSQEGSGGSVTVTT